MSITYLFDVDGTLTPAKKKIDTEFAKTFYKWQKGKEVYIVSGGSFVRIIDQLGRQIVDETAGVFGCMGNTFYKKISVCPDGYSEWAKIYQSPFEIDKPDLFYSTLEQIVMASAYPTKTGEHYEKRPGMVNFSIVGGSATVEERAEYKEYDRTHEERKEIIAKLKSKYPTLDFVIGGAVSIDIFNKGNDKSQVIKKYLNNTLKFVNNKVVFVGDRITSPGNDHALANLLEKHASGYVFEVESWQDTAALLKTDLFASG
jgi:phosphomannomutase|tara:strand:+ start:3506 stop:4279 length:774 start_codon:yes stop_codon:yes gene_type:complete